MAQENLCQTGVTTVLAEWKLYAIIALIVGAFGLGFYTCHKFNQAALQKQTEARLKDVSKGTTSIIDFNGKVDNAIGKDDCALKPMPAKLRVLLK